MLQRHAGPAGPLRSAPLQTPVPRLFRILTTLCALALATGCGTARKDVFPAESFRPESPFERAFASDADSTCEAARRALLSQGYLMTSLQDSRLTATKAFQPTEAEHMTIDFTVSCIGSIDGETTAYANAVQTRYELKTTPNSYGLSAPIIGALSLPFGSRAENLVKTGAATITDGEFYQRFWSLVSLHLAPVSRSAER